MTVTSARQLKQIRIKTIDHNFCSVRNAPWLCCSGEVGVKFLHTVPLAVTDENQFQIVYETNRAVSLKQNLSWEVLVKYEISLSLSLLSLIHI